MFDEWKVNEKGIKIQLRNIYLWSSKKWKMRELFYEKIEEQSGRWEDVDETLCCGFSIRFVWVTTFLSLLLLLLPLCRLSSRMAFKDIDVSHSEISLRCTNIHRESKTKTKDLRINIRSHFSLRRLRSQPCLLSLCFVCHFRCRFFSILFGFVVDSSSH